MTADPGGPTARFCSSTSCVLLHGSALGDKSILGVQVRVKFVLSISVRWSVTRWASVLYSCLQAVVCSTLKLRETLMNTLNVIVLVGAALLPVPGW